MLYTYYVKNYNLNSSKVLIQKVFNNPKNTKKVIKLLLRVYYCKTIGLLPFKIKSIKLSLSKKALKLNDNFTSSF